MTMSENATSPGAAASAVPGVGLNGEPDDFAARYDRMTVGKIGPRLVRIAIAVAIVLALMAAADTLLGL